MPTDLRICFKPGRGFRDILDQELGYDPRQGITKEQLFQGAKSTLPEIVVQTVEKPIRLRNCSLDFFYRKPVGKNNTSVHMALIQGSRQLHFLFPQSQALVRWNAVRAYHVFSWIRLSSGIFLLVGLRGFSAG